jgi:hypothetical protein
LQGGNEVFAIDHNGAIYVNSTNTYRDWRLVDSSQQYVALSATQNDTVFALTSSGMLYQEMEHLYSNPYHHYYYWTNQNISGGKQFTGAISADQDASGRDEIYAVEQGTNTLYLYDQGSWTQKDTEVADVAGADGGFFYDVNNYNGTYYAYLYNPQTQTWTYLGSNLS